MRPYRAGSTIPGSALTLQGDRINRLDRRKLLMIPLQSKRHPDRITSTNDEAFDVDTIFTSGTFEMKAVVA